MYDFSEMEGMECCLWPHLYPFTSWCETVLKGNESRLSRKVSFLTRTFSQVIDYSLQFELLQFEYDLWIFKTVSGHRLLLDAVNQFGYPTVFVPISPYESTFPIPSWLSKIREKNWSRFV